MGDAVPRAEPLSEGEVLKQNFASIRRWIDANKSRIKAKPNRTLLYSGKIYDLDVVRGLSAEDRKAYSGTPIWQAIEKHRKLHRERSIPFDYQKLEDVLKSIKDHPVITDRDRQPKHFANAYDFFESLPSLPKILPDARKLSQQCWDRLSEIFAGNAEGDIRILDGMADNFGKLEHHKVLFRKEIDALLKNSKLSNKGKAVLLDKITKYGERFDRRYTDVTRALQEAAGHLKRCRR